MTRPQISKPSHMLELFLTRSAWASEGEMPGIKESVCLGAMPARDGSNLILDAEIGALWHYPDDVVTLSTRSITLEDRVARQRNGVPDSESWDMFVPDSRSVHEYLPFVPAKQSFDTQYEKWHALRRLPFLDPEYDGDRDMNLDEIGPPNDFHRDLIQRKQTSMVSLLEDCGWPHEDSWNRERFIQEWKL